MWIVNQCEKFSQYIWFVYSIIIKFPLLSCHNNCEGHINKTDVNTKDDLKQSNYNKNEINKNEKYFNLLFCAFEWHNNISNHVFIYWQNTLCVMQILSKSDINMENYKNKISHFFYDISKLITNNIS